MRDNLYVPLGHMAARAIIRRALPAPHWERHGATGIGMANQAFASVIGRRLLPAGLEVRVMAGKATQLSVALPVALAQRHREIMFQEVGLHRSFALERRADARFPGQRDRVARARSIRAKPRSRKRTMPRGNRASRPRETARGPYELVRPDRTIPWREAPAQAAPGKPRGESRVSTICGLCSSF